MSTLTRTVLESTSGLAFTPVSATAGNLVWTANPRALSYVVRRNGTIIGSPTANSYGDTGLSASTSYTYTVATVAATGEGPQTAGVQGTTLAAPDTTAPTAPVITATATGQNTISVALTTPATDAQSGVASYDLDYKTAAAGTYTTITPVTAGQFPYVIGGLSAATTHNTRARARDTVGNIGAYSAVSNATTQAATGTANPLYSALDMATVPFHNGATAAGPQVVFQTAALPNITSTVNVANAAQLSAALAVPGRRAVMTANISGAQLTGVNIADNEIVIPNGLLLNGLTLCGYQSPDTLSRFRVTKASTDTGIGGRLHRLQVYGAGATDIIFDGVQLSASTADPAIPTYIDTTGGSARHAFIRCQIISPVAAYGYGVPHLLVAGCSVYHDANNVGNSGDWGFRCSARGAYIFYQNDIRGPNYSHIRFHPASGSGGYVAHIEDNTFLDRDTADFGRTVDIFETDGTAGLPGMQGAWMRSNRFYVNGSVFFQIQRQISGAGSIVDYLEVTNNVVNGSATGFAAGSSAASNITGNTYNAAPGSDPAWGAAGDPTGINWNI